MIKVPSLWIGRQVAFGKFYSRNLTTWASASSNLLMTHRALDYCINSVSDQLAGERAKLVTVFFGTQHLKFATQIAEETAKRINSEVDFFKKISQFLLEINFIYFLLNWKGDCWMFYRYGNYWTK